MTIRRWTGDEKGRNAASGGGYTNTSRIVRPPLADVD